MFKLPKINLKNLKSKTDDNTFFTIDIGSNSIKCLVFEFNENEKNKVKLIGSAKEILEPGLVRAGNIIEIEKVAESLDIALFRATENLEQEVSNAIFGVGGDLCINLTTTARVKRELKNKIEAFEFDEINEKLVAAAHTKAQEIIYKTTGNPDIDIDLITSATVYTKVDGTYVESYDALSGQNIEHAMFTSFSPGYHLNSISQVSSMLKLDIKAITSNMYAFTQSLKYGSDSKQLDGILVDIGGDKTEIDVIFSGGIVTAKILPIGGNHLTIALSQETGLTFTEAQRKKHDYTYGNLAEGEIISIETPLNEATSIWLNGLELLFTEFNGVKTFPTDIFLVGGSSKLPLISEALQTKPWTKAIPFKEPPEFSKATADKFEHIQDTTGSAQDEELAIAAALSIIYLEMQEPNND